jgi:hypothetical protein
MVNQGGKDPSCVTPKDIVDLAFFESRLAPVVPLLRSIDSTFSALFGLVERLPPSYTDSDSTPSQDWAAIFTNRRYEVESYKFAVSGLLEKCACVQRLSEGLLNHQNQINAQRQTQATLRLTNATADDSAYVRVITAITVVFLSSTAVAVCIAMTMAKEASDLLTLMQTLFSTPFFYLHDDRSLAVSPSFWIFVAVSIPLTLLTVLYWRWSLLRKRRQRNRLTLKNEDLLV